MKYYTIVQFMNPKRFLKVALFNLMLASVGSTLRADEPPPLSPKDKLVVETILRLKDFDIESSAPAKESMLRYLRAQPGTEPYFELIERFKPIEIAEELTQFSLEHANETSGARGAKLLFDMDQVQGLGKILDDPKDPRVEAAIALVDHAGGRKTVDLLWPYVMSTDAPLTQRAAAVAAVGRRIPGQQKLLALAKDDKLAKDLKFAAANALLSSADASISEEAKKYLELPATADSQPLPPLAELVQRRGNTEAGAVLFRKTGTCINCHKVRGEGKEVGPDLSEIGTKLSREAMYISILDPSAAISHNFENYSLLTDDATTITGLLVSETDELVTLRTGEGIDKTVSKDEIEIFQKQKLSLMPQDLQKLLTVDQLVDLVEYAMTLKK